MEIEEEMKWVADLKQQLLPLTEVFEEQIWMKQCIYRVPARVKDISVKAFEPKMVSFGPYHHGKPNLEPMEYHKRRALYRFLERTDKPLEEFGEALEEVVEELMDSYEYLEERWRDKDQFLPLMLFDGCFLLEVMRGPSENYSQYDPIFSVHGVLNTFHYIVPDMMMVENQVPLLALARLWALSNGISFEEGESAINARVIKLFFPGLTLMETRMGLHILDVFRKAVIQDPWTRVPFDPNLDAPQSLRSATDLHEAGVIFRRSATYSVKDISFQNGVLTMPGFVIESSSETIYFNTIAFERLRPEAGHDIRTYIIFMFGLANSTEDVIFLKSQGLIQSTLGSNEAVADLLNLLSRDIFFDPSNRLSLIRDELNEYYILNMNKWRKRMRDWRKNLKLNYFNSPWALISVIAAGAVLLVTLAQTYYTILSYYQGNPK